MRRGKPVDLRNRIGFETRLREASKKVLLSLKPKSLGVLHRKPLLDEDYPEASDVDTIAIWNQPDEYPERLAVRTSSSQVFVDVLWIPLSIMVDPAKAASYRMLPHLLLESEADWFRSDQIRHLVDLVKIHTYDRTVWEQRLRSHIQYGDEAVQESCRNLDFLPATLFFLQTARSLYLIALADCMKRSVMSLRTRPMAKLRRMTREISSWSAGMFEENLLLNRNPSPMLEALRRIYDEVAAKCRGSSGNGMSSRTLGHYSYTLSPLELKYRHSVAEAMIKRGDHANATFYIRFWAYCLSRCPIVLEAAGKGENPSFYVPQKPLRTSLEASCPEIIDDLALVFGGGIAKAEAGASIKKTCEFRLLVMEEIRKRGFALRGVEENLRERRVDL